MREKILFIVSRFPYPLVGGDRITSYNILQFLSQHYDVYFVAITHTPLEKQALDSITPFCKVCKVFHKSKYRSAFQSLLALFGKEPLQVGYYYFHDVQHYLHTLTHTHKIQKLLCALIRTAKYAKSLPIQTKIINMADSLAHHYQNAITNSHSLIWKAIYKIEYRRLQCFESQCVQEFGASLFFNHKEQQMYAHIGNALLAPHGVNPALFTMTYDTTRYNHTICFFGKMDYRPNIEAVQWFAKNVMPLLDERIELMVLGANPTRELTKLQSTRIHILGYVENPYEILCSCLCVIAPMQSGAGIQNKILESMALGQIVLTNPLGANPIREARHDTHLLIAHTAQEFAYYIHDIARNPQSYQSLKANAKALVRAHYTWEAYGSVLLEALKHTNPTTHKDTLC
ncbi:glycosyltransferase [uncultured Helicobacter sp.]|mgnify:CR=1 FL=1|uniref:glycosyltransferase n=2 Tax=uncultured Helicobacter sp. TaxID=175537 RepID=UPI001C3B49F3|nr:glycosyltransferase [Candidatus Helicobacter avicola]